jgi:hypothetical protein
MDAETIAERQEPIRCALDLIVMADRGDVDGMQECIKGIKLFEIADVIGSMSHWAVIGMHAMAHTNGLNLGGQVEAVKAAMTAEVQDGQQ